MVDKKFISSLFIEDMFYVIVVLSSLLLYALIIFISGNYDRDNNVNNSNINFRNNELTIIEQCFYMPINFPTNKFDSQV